MSTTPTTDAGASATTLVLAVGNPLMGDDGLGVAVLDRLREWDWPSGVALVDGETWGMRLLPYVEDARRLLVIDAIDVGAPPGSIVSLDGAEVPRRLDARISSHEVNLADVLALAALRGTGPTELCAMGAQPLRIEFGATLSPAIAAVVDTVADLARAQLAAWGLAGRATAETAGA